MPRGKPLDGEVSAVRPPSPGSQVRLEEVVGQVVTARHGIGPTLFVALDSSLVAPSADLEKAHGYRRIMTVVGRGTGYRQRLGGSREALLLVTPHGVDKRERGQSS